ncbi:uncharacterized protein plekhg6 [Esox lucius]|uniref:uncharacterized protein plekhg6 n=1 Tax=Esox lucius TaxID=8010 RepID=UPI001476BC75|nr:uncharacterized protein plekhg6 [Esox lucius]
MNPTNPSATNFIHGGGRSELTQTEEAAEERREGGEREQQRELERETNVTDGVTLAAETVANHRVSADKHRLNTVGYQRKPKQKVVSEYSTVSKGAQGSVKPRPALIQVLFNQGANDKSSIPEERDQLDSLKQVLEEFLVPECLNWTWGEDGTKATLENNWTEIVHNNETMCKTQRHQQEALWELVHTELTYINKLTIVTDLVMAALINLHQHGFLSEVTPEQLFSNLSSILSAHRLFWQEVIYPMLLEVRRTGKPFDPLVLEAGCLQFPERFLPYLQYCWEGENTLELTRRLTDTNLHFHTYLLWLESHPQCERMRLGDMQAKPHQRITKYPLLLKAILKNTQDPHTQNVLRGMLASVNGFLESINSYLRLKDEELALSLSAQKIEGYSTMEGMSEEIDKHVKEFCRFDLTCPVRGVGPGVIRKLLLEETLKIRGRKDNKLEVIALLFSDVLLVTKAQKKAERLKVVHPPLALDRVRCVALKDGCSFVVIEVSVLGGAVNVYTFYTSAETCSTWVSTIQKAQVTLHALREREVSNQLMQIQQRALQLQEQAKLHREPKEESVDQHPDQSEPDITYSKEVKHNEELIILSVNGTSASIATEVKQQIQQPMKYKDAVLPGKLHKTNISHSQSMLGGSAGWLMKNSGRVTEGFTISEAGKKEVGDINQWEEEAESRMITERRVTWNHSRQSNSLQPEDANTFQPRPKTNGPLDGYPEIDYLPNTSSTSPASPSMENHPNVSITISQMEAQRFPSKGFMPTQRNSDPQSVLPAVTRDTRFSQSGKEEALDESSRFSRKLKSPRLRRRKLMSASPSMSWTPLAADGSGMGQPAPHTNSSSNSDSDYNQKLRDSRPRPDPHLVLNLGSVNKNKGVFWDKDFCPGLYTFTDTEMPNRKPKETVNTQKRSMVKTQRSASITDIVLHDGSPLTSARHTNLRIAPSPPPGLDPYLHPSPVEAILYRAKERKKDGGKREDKGNSTAWELLPSPAFSTTPLESPNNGDGESDWEEVELVRCRAPSVSQKWIEERVDGDVDEEEKNNPAFPDGASVDWSGWCLDADEILRPLPLEDSGVGVDEEMYLIREGREHGFNRLLSVRDSLRIARKEDRTISQV